MLASERTCEMTGLSDTVTITLVSFRESPAQDVQPALPYDTYGGQPPGAQVPGNTVQLSLFHSNLRPYHNGTSLTLKVTPREPDAVSKSCPGQS